jgi:hypothetical protein
VQTDLHHLEASQPVDQDAVNELYRRYKAAFDEYNAQWQEMRMEDESAPSTVPKA